MIQNAYSRLVRDLSGRWPVIVEPYEPGYRVFHGDPWPHCISIHSEEEALQLRRPRIH